MAVLARRPRIAADAPAAASWHAAQGLRYHEPVEGRERWVVETPNGRYVRLGADAVTLLRAAADLPMSELVPRLGPGWDVATASRALAAMEELGLAQRGDAAAVPAPARRARRLRFAAPCSVQLTLLDPGRWMASHHNLMSRLASNLTAAALMVVGAVGLLVLAAQAAEVDEALTSPLPLVAVSAVIAAFLAISSLHELGHAAALHREGGRARRLGVMVLYLSPALFCDTSDGWRLPERRSRVRTSLAGVVVHFGFGGLTGIAATLAGGETRTCLLDLAALCYLGALLNLLPVVKLDGYLALMAALDIPFLRVKAVNDWRSWLAHALFGSARGTPELRGRPWGPAFGLASVAAPAVIVAGVAWDLFGALANWGRVGPALGLAAVMVGIWFTGRGLWRLLRLAFNRGARPWRIVAGLLVLVASGGGLLAVPVPNVISAGYVVQGGRAQLVIGQWEQARLLRPGATVELEQEGLGLKRQVGTSRLLGGARRTTVPLSALAPFLITSARTGAYAFALSSVHWSGPHRWSGAAAVRLGSLSIGRWIAARLVRIPLETLVG